MSGPRILMMAGGTGGHVFPALAVADELRARGAHIVWLGTRAGLEARVAPAAGYAMEWIGVAGLRGKGLATWMAAPWRLAKALVQALGIVRRVAPAAVVGMGGFASGPGGIAAWLLRRPLLIHEQNAAAGLTNRSLARVATVCLQAFPGALTGARTVGNPVRAQILALPAPARRLAGRTGPVRLLVLGGSGGALALNQLLPEAIARLPVAARPAVRHQTGKSLAAAKAAYARCAVTGEIIEFIDDIAAAYDWADLVVCRAGALTVAELAAAGLGALLVPYPYAADDHQSANADYLAARGAALCIQQRELTAARLADELTSLCGDRQRLLRMAQAARGAAWPRATSDIAAACMDLAGVAA